MKLEKTLTVKDIKEFLGVSRLTVWKWCKSGRLPAFKFGGEWRIRKEDFDKVIEDQINSRK